MPLYEAVLADSQWVVGADHPITKAARRNLGTARGAGGQPFMLLP
jgi:hypothetical protein